jgi:hypothetical protein
MTQVLAAPQACSAQGPSSAWIAAVMEHRNELLSIDEAKRPEASQEVLRKLNCLEPVYTDWLLQDGLGLGKGFASAAKPAAERVADLLVSLDASGWRTLARAAGSARRSRETADVLTDSQAPVDSWAQAYIRACEARRTERLRPLFASGWPGVVFTTH